MRASFISGRRDELRRSARDQRGPGHAVCLRQRHQVDKKRKNCSPGVAITRTPLFHTRARRILCACQLDLFVLDKVVFPINIGSSPDCPGVGSLLRCVRQCPRLCAIVCYQDRGAPALSSLGDARPDPLDTGSTFHEKAGDPHL